MLNPFPQYCQESRSKSNIKKLGGELFLPKYWWKEFSYENSINNISLILNPDPQYGLELDPNPIYKK